MQTQVWIKLDLFYLKRSESKGDSWDQYQQVSNTPQQKKETSAVMKIRINRKKETKREGSIRLDSNICVCKFKGDVLGQHLAGYDNNPEASTSQERCNNSKL